MGERPHGTMAERQRVRRTALVREEVIEAALAEFAERGYHQTSISDIAKRLGTGHSMFYRYFANKRDILEHVVQHVQQRLQQAIIGTLPRGLSSLDDFTEYAVKLGMTCIDVLIEDPRLARLLVLQMNSVDQQMTADFHSAFDGGVAALSVLLLNGIAQGFIRADIDVTATAESVVAIPFGLLMRHAQHFDRDGLGSRVHATVELVTRGIATSM